MMIRMWSVCTHCSHIDGSSCHSFVETCFLEARRFLQQFDGAARASQTGSWNWQPSSAHELRVERGARGTKKGGRWTLVQREPTYSQIRHASRRLARPWCKRSTLLIRSLEVRETWLLQRVTARPCMPAHKYFRQFLPTAVQFLVKQITSIVLLDLFVFDPYFLSTEWLSWNILDVHHRLSPVWVFATHERKKNRTISFKKMKGKWQWTGLFFAGCVCVYVRPLPLTQSTSAHTLSLSSFTLSAHPHTHHSRSHFHFLPTDHESLLPAAISLRDELLEVSWPPLARYSRSCSWTCLFPRLREAALCAHTCVCVYVQSNGVLFSQTHPHALSFSLSLSRIYVYIYTHVCQCVSERVCACVCMYICICVYDMMIYIHMYVHMYICTYV